MELINAFLRICVKSKVTRSIIGLVELLDDCISGSRTHRGSLISFIILYLLYLVGFRTKPTVIVLTLFEFLSILLNHLLLVINFIN